MLIKNLILLFILLSALPCFGSVVNINTVIQWESDVNFEIQQMDDFLDSHPEGDRFAAGVAALKVILWQQTNNVKYADDAAYILERIVYHWKGKCNFFTPYPFCYAYQRLDQAGRLKSSFKADATIFAENRFKRKEFADQTEEIHNRNFARACGLEYCSQLWPDSPKAKKWHNYAVDFWDLFMSLEDVPENAPNYNELDVCYIWVLSDLLGNTDQLNRKSIQDFFMRFANQLAPSGKIP